MGADSFASLRFLEPAAGLVPSSQKRLESPISGAAALGLAHPLLYPWPGNGVGAAQCQRGNVAYTSHKATLSFGPPTSLAHDMPQQGSCKRLKHRKRKDGVAHSQAGLRNKAPNNIKILGMRKKQTTQPFGCLQCKVSRCSCPGKKPAYRLPSQACSNSMPHSVCYSFLLTSSTPSP